MSPPAKPLACILAGGQSARMRRDKAALPYRGRPLIEHALASLHALGCQVIISGSRPDLAHYAPVVPDLHPGCGPLSGIEAALAAASVLTRQADPGSTAADHPDTAALLFLPIDLPLLPPGFLTLLLNRAERTGAAATVPCFGGRPQPLCAVYRRSLLPSITAALEAGEYKVMRALDRALTASQQRGDFFAVEAVLTSRAMPANPDAVSSIPREPAPPYRWFANINTPLDLQLLNDPAAKAPPSLP